MGEYKGLRHVHRSQRGVEKFSCQANLAGVTQNEFNLNVSRYVDVFDPEEEIDVGKLQKIYQIEGDLLDVRKLMAKYLKELGIDG